MAGERRFTRIPPESSGDRVGMHAFIDVLYNSATGTFAIGDEVNFVTSGLGGVIAYVRDDGGNAGLITIDLDQASREGGTVASVSENIQVDGITIAQAADTGTEIYIPKYHVASGDNPERLQLVDEQGSAYTRFGEGPAQLDAFGKLRISQSYLQGNYTFNNGLRTDMTAETATGGTVTYDATAGHVLLNCTTTTGSAAYYTTDLWHHYYPGISQLGLFSLYNGDTGKTNHRRRWGLFDEFNGVFFELNDTTMYVVIRSNVSGSVVETRIAQTDWNTDVLDGTGGADNLSGVTLTPTNINLYWIDFEWLGAGQIRFGIFSEGKRITCHRHNHSASSAWAKYGNYPIRFECENTGAAGSGSSLHVICASVHSEADLDNLSQFAPQLLVHAEATDVTDTDTYVATLRTTANTHDAFLAKTLDILAIDGANDCAMEITYTINADLTGASFTSIGSTNLEIDTSASAANLAAGFELSVTPVKGYSSQSFDTDNLQKSAYKGKADGTPFAVTITARRIDGLTSNSTFHANFDFRVFDHPYG